MSKNEATHGDIVPSYIAGAAFANNYRAVQLATARNTVDLATANTHYAVWITQSTAEQWEAVAVKRTWFSLAVVGAGNWTKGAYLTPWTAWTLVATTTAWHIVCARAMEIGTAGELGEVMILPQAVKYSSIA
jgi:hypothetical protein